MNRFRTVLVSLGVMGCTSIAIAQWTTVYQDDITHFQDAAFPTDHRGYVAASDTDGAVVLRTSDGGSTWNKRHIAGWNRIDRIAMIDSTTGYLIRGGVSGRLLKTTDGFNSFVDHLSDTSFTVQAMSLVDASAGFYLNNESRLRRFTNDGSNIYHVMDTLTGGQSLQFTDAQTGYLDTGTGLLRTTDQGVAWSYVNSDLGFFCVVFSFADQLTGYFSDGTSIHVTHDGGATLPLQYPFPNSFGLAAQGDHCVAANDMGDVAYTTDAGLDWTTEATGINVLVAEPYKVFLTPGGSCFIFSNSSGEIRERDGVISGIPQEMPGTDVQVYPDSFVSETTIDLGDHPLNATIRLTDVSGKEVRSVMATGKKTLLQKGDMRPGLYFLQVADGTSVLCRRKIIVL